MKKLLKYSVLALALTLGSGTYARAETVSVAYNGTFDQIITFLFGWMIGNNHHPDVPKNGDPKPQVAPEIDPEMAMSALFLLGGTLTAIRSRRRS